MGGLFVRNMFHINLFVLLCVFFFPVLRNGKFNPVCVYGTKKYGPNGMYNEESFKKYNFGKSVSNVLVNAANHSLANTTWSTYNTVKNLLEKCEICLKKKFKFPMQKNEILLFISWLLTKRKVKGNTINVYISALRTIHLTKGVVIKELRPG